MILFYNKCLSGVCFVRNCFLGVVISFLRSFYRERTIQLDIFGKIKEGVELSLFLNRSINFRTFCKKLWICFLIFLVFPSCRRGSFDRVKESSLQYLCKSYLFFAITSSLKSICLIVIRCTICIKATGLIILIEKF